MQIRDLRDNFCCDIKMLCPNPYLDVNIHDTQHNTIFKKYIGVGTIDKKQCDKVSVLAKVSSLRNII